MKTYLLVDFGSTYTKLSLVDIDGARILAKSSSRTTVDSNIMEGYEAALKKLQDLVDFEKIEILDSLACSSAKGGLKIIAIGITPLYTVEAAKRSALGAGARILRTYNYLLGDKEIGEIEGLDPDIILLSGGAEGGNTYYITSNARTLTKMKKKIPIIVAGNSDSNDEIKDIFDGVGMDYEISENLMPDVNTINPEPVRETIRRIFMKQIVLSKGMEEVEKITKNLLMPTPTAVIKAAELLAEGYGDQEGLGQLMVIDLGGATTDIHTVCHPVGQKQYIYEGLTEPYIKRTVEGDLGMRHSAPGVLECVGEAGFLNYDKGLVSIRESCQYRCENPDLVFSNEEDLAFDEIIAKISIRLAVERHSGSLRKSFQNGRNVFIQKGKDLREIDYIIGTGGIIINSKNQEDLLGEAFFEIDGLLSPQKANLLVDREYIMSAMGLLSFVDKELSLKILSNNLKEL